MSRRPRITDTVRLDWLTSSRAETEYVTAKVGPGWIREAGWKVIVRNVTAGSGDTLRQAIDAAMNLKEKIDDKG